jgi:Protein of unknown function (DUF3102)
VSNNLPALANQADRTLASHAVAIRALSKRVVADVIEIGRRLTECRVILKGHGGYRAWVDSELGLSPQTAGRFIQVYELSQGRSNLEHLDLPVSALYLLAAPSTPKSAREAIIERAQAGEPVSVAKVNQTIETTKGRQQPAHSTASAPSKAKPSTIKFTPERIGQTRNLVERGMSREQIAEVVGVTVGSLQVRCSRLGISLRRPPVQTKATAVPPPTKDPRGDIGLASAGEIARKDEELRKPLGEGEAGELGALLRAWDRASESARQKFMLRVGLVAIAREPFEMPDIPDFLRRGAS